MHQPTVMIHKIYEAISNFGKMKPFIKIDVSYDTWMFFFKKTYVN